MKKIIILIGLMILATDYAGAQRFERLKKPDFFVPDFVDFDAPEKIPTSRIRKTTVRSVEKNNLNETSKVPFYKFKYDEYINDIMAFYSSGTMPKNPVLEKDLAEMNSEEPKEIIAPAPDMLTSYEMSEFYKLYKMILDN